ncbi:MAG: microcystin-dependent protein [Neolewinella sp.]|jgi:microcystin-dependent protein
MIGQIQMLPYNFAPRSWAFCDGQILAISTNTALFSLLGTIYGGDGRTTFALPDLRGRAALHQGTGPGLSLRPNGQRSGTQDYTLNVQNLASHNHQLGAGSTLSIPVSGEDADQDEAAGKYLANGTFYHNNPDGVYGAGALPASGTTLPTGSNQTINNMQPYLTMHWCIALVGTYPSRS